MFQMLVLNRIQVLPSNLYSALLTKYGNGPFHILLIGTGSKIEGHQGTIGSLHTKSSGVFKLRIMLMCVIMNVALGRYYWSRQVVKYIYKVAKLRKQAATIYLLTASPRALGIIVVASVPEAGYLHQVQFPQLAFVYQSLYSLHWWVVPILLHCENQLAVCLIASIILSHDAVDIAIGFSTTACIPDVSAAMVCDSCR